MEQNQRHAGSSALAVLLAACAIALSNPGKAVEWLDQLDQALYIESPQGFFRSDLSIQADLEAYHSEKAPPGLLFEEDDFFWNPRLSLYLDTRLGEHLYSLVLFRVDRGFDPGAVPGGEGRFDEYLLRYTPFEDPRINFQIGKFATVFGNWVERHDSWNNPLITAPLAYENVMVVGDQAAPPSRAGFAGRRNLADNKRGWLPVIWGPSYAAGASVFGLVDKFEYALELKNASISSRPFAWDPFTVDWDHPTVTARLGFRPNAAWNVGLSGSYGAYLLPGATLPAGSSVGQFKQLTFGPDLRYSWRHWELWSEAFFSRFEVPIVGNADTFVYYVETRYKLTPRWFLAGRWNQQFFGEVPNGRGGEQRWDRDVWRLDGGVGYRFGRHLQAKLQYSYAHENGSPKQGDQLVAGQVTVRF